MSNYIINLHSVNFQAESIKLHFYATVGEIEKLRLCC